MSHEATAWARAQKTGNSPAKFVLMVLADAAGSDHSCWPSLAYLAGLCEMGESTVRAATKRLAEQGLIRVFYRHRSSGLRRSCRYQLLVDGPGTIEPDADDWSNYRRMPAADNRSEPADDNRSERADEPLGASVSARSEPADIPYKEPSLKREASVEPVRAPRSATATRVPEDFYPDEKMSAWFTAEKLHEVIHGKTEHEKFMDYWRAAPGVKGRKQDWPATWRNWMRTAAERAGRNGARPVSAPPGTSLMPSTGGAPSYNTTSTTNNKILQTLAIREKFRQQEEN